MDEINRRIGAEGQEGDVEQDSADGKWLFVN
jgi:hypothetical protein